MAILEGGLQLPAMAFICTFLVFCCILGIAGDVPDGAVYTDLHKTIEKGNSGAVLKCQFYGTPIAVFWRKGDDPSTAPNLITWVEGEPDSGTCVKDKTCEMGDDYSLIIKNVSIADQGRYICRVSNYKGILIHNFTDVTVFAVPEEPFPTINSCKENRRANCTVHATNPLNITCIISRYFPSVDLFFLHGGQKLTTTQTSEWTNADRTKNKAISTKGQTSDIPYFCVAFNIPGSRDQRTATVSVISQEDVATRDDTKFLSTITPFQHNVPLGTNFIKIVLPIAIAVSGVVVAVAVYLVLRKKHRKHRENRGEKGNDGESQSMIQRMDIKEHLSYYELWMLVCQAHAGGDDMRKLCDTFLELHITDIKSGCTPEEAYHALCRWKDGKQTGNRLQALKDALQNADYTTALKYICEMREKKDCNKSTISQETFVHILWEIENTYLVNRFLGELIPDRETSDILDSEKMGDVVKDATSVLRDWSSRPFEVNPMVLVSIALERAGCTPMDKKFLTVPRELLSPILPRGVEKFTNKLTSRHCKRLAATLEISDKLMDNIIEKNYSLLFDTRKMVTEWLRVMECSNYKKRCTLDDAIIKIGRYDLEDFFGTIAHRHKEGVLQDQPHLQSYKLDHESIYDDDIPQLVQFVEHLPPEEKIQLYKKIGFDQHAEDGIKDKNNVGEKLKEWRDNIVSQSSKDEALKEFRSLREEIAGDTKYSEITLTDEEIEDVSAHVTSTDKQRELLKKLNINTSAQQITHSFGDRLKAWRNSETKTFCRDTLRKALSYIGFAECIVGKAALKYVCNAELADVAFNLLMHDAHPLIEALGIKQRKIRRYINPVFQGDEGTIGLVLQLMNTMKGKLQQMKGKILSTERGRDDFSTALMNIGLIDVARSVYLDYEISLSELLNIITCAGLDDMGRFMENLDLSRDDREECRDSEGQIDRLKLMRLWKHQIRPVPYHYRLEIATALRATELVELANDVLAGKHQKKMPNADAVQDICSRVSFPEMRKVCSLLELGPSKSREGSTTLLTRWVNEWMNNFNPKDSGLLSSHMKERKRVNDLLFSNGYHELAEEISTLENNCRP